MSSHAGDIDYNKVDMATLSNYSDVITEHVHFDWNINFNKKTMRGTVTLKMKMLQDAVGVIELDSSLLAVAAVRINGADCNFKIADKYKALGNKLTITVPGSMQKKDAALSVTIAYSVGTDSTAMQWLDASSTKGGQHPYLFTQCEAIHARAMFPCQDTPAVKATYSAVVTAPAWCTVLMSALADDTQVPASTKGKKGVFGFNQPVPIPAYLVAVAAGQLASKDLSHRVRVWSEPEMVDAVAFEFSQTEEFLVAAEELTMPYQWTRYDVLCLPPSFPYGGMENPCLTFATPTLLAGDKSLADVIAHEIAHSWTGNLVTNATWEHFWLNEGWTVWLERKIGSRVKNSKEQLKLSATAGWKTLVDSVEGYGADSEFTKLVRAPTDGDPDEAFSSVPYEKGFNLLFYLETLVGTETFEAFAKSYIAQFQRITVTSGEFRDHFVGFVKDNGTPKQVKTVATIDWDQLFHCTGMPAHTPDFTTPLVSAATELSQKWISAADCCITAKNGFEKANTANWGTQQFNIFLDALLLQAKNVAPLSEEKLLQLDALYSFNSTGNNEVKFRWQCLCLSTGVEWIVPKVVEFLKAQGRMKYVRPLYRALNACSAVNGTLVAKTTFIQNSQIYHPIARKMVADDLKVTDEELKVASAKPASAVSKSSSASSSCCKKAPHLCSTLFSTWPRVLATSGVFVGIAAAAWFFFNRNSKKASK